MKTGSRILKTFRCCVKIIKEKWKDGKRLFALELFLGLTQEAKALLMMLFPAIIIQWILDAAKIDKVLLFIFLTCVIMTIISICVEVLKRSLSNNSLRALNYLILNLNNHAMNIELKDFESSETMEQFDKAYDGLWNSSDVDYYIFTVILSKLLSFCVTAYIFISIHWMVILIVIFTLLSEFWLDIRLAEKLHEKDQQQSALRNKKSMLLMLFSIAKPIRRYSFMAQKIFSLINIREYH